MKSVSMGRQTLTNEGCYQKLQSIGQTHLLRYWHALNSTERENLCREITELDLSLYQRQRSLILKGKEKKMHYEPIREYSLVSDSNIKEKGFEIAREGKVAIVVLAGGQGSRLRCQRPKGCYAITPILCKSLFQFLSEKIRAAGRQSGCALEVAFMTSPLNHAETLEFFKKGAFFGLNPQKVNFFNQKMWPFLDLKGNLFLESPSQLARGPNGNGEVFRALILSGIWDKWERKGIEIVNVLPIDNPLADPCDHALFGFHRNENCDVAVKTTHRYSPYEKLGVLARIDGKTCVIEYSELDEKERFAVDQDGNLKFHLANLGLMSFSMPFIKKASLCQLPLHSAKKSVNALDEQGKVFFPEQPNAWKFEEFIFDVLPFANKVKTILCPRELCFAPLKNLSGEDSIATVREALLDFDRRIFFNVTGIEPPRGARIELDPQFYYPTEELKAKWRGKPLPQESYIHE
jgi:UDP-N-acetylglucosamine/UDP-N-acetylgalactosamine diphosphorylase